MKARLEMSEEALLLYSPGDGAAQTIIDFKDLLGNLSTIPLNSLDKNTITIPVLIRNLTNEYNEKSPSMEKPLDIVSVMLTISLLIKHSMSHFKPCKILEIGYQNGSLSYFITKTAVAINQDSKVFCLSEALYGPSFMKILTELGSAVANLSLLTASNETDMLRDDYFDFVVINGGEFMENPSGVIANAVRAVRPGGRLLCLTGRQYLLNSCFAVYVDDYDEYFITDDSSILVKVIDKKDKENARNYTSDHLYVKMYNLNGDVCRIIDDVTAASPEELRETVGKIGQMEDIAIKLFAQLADMELKYRLNCVKEALLNYIYTSESAHREKCAQQLHDFAVNLKKRDFRQ